MLLEQADGCSRAIQWELEILEDEVVHIHDELFCAQEAKFRDYFSLRLLESERDSAKTQLSLTQRDFEFEKGRLNSNLLALQGELDSVC